MSILSVGTDTQATPFRIKILDGLEAGKELRLEGRALPYRGIAYETQQRSKLTYYAGNPVASQQILGPTDSPTSINGMWKDNKLGDGVARQLADTFDDLCRSGATVEVVWGDRADAVAVSKPLVRRGIVKRFKHTYDRVQDVVWEMEFEFQGRDEPTAPPLTSAGVITTKEGFGELVSQLTSTLDTIDAAASGPFDLLSGFSQATLQALEVVQDSLNQTVDFFNATEQSVKTTATLPRDVLERGKLLAQASWDSTKAFGKAVLADLKLSTGIIGGRDEGLGLLDQRDGMFDLLQNLDHSQELCSQTQEALSGQIEPEVIAEVTPIPGSDLRDLAQRFYGDADLWPIIANYNGLDTSRVPNRPDGPTADVSRPLLIPRRPEGELAMMSQGVC